MFNTLFPKDWSSLKKIAFIKGSGSDNVTLSGDIVSFNSSGIRPIKSLEVRLEPIQDLHGQDAPYPAGGGKNKFDPQYFTGNVNTHYLDFFGGHSNTGDYKANGISVKANTTYSVTIILPSAPSNNTSWGVYGVYTESISSITFSANAQGAERIFTFTPDTDTKVVFWGYIGNTWSDYGITSIDNIKVQVEEGSATPWKPYSNICPITGWTGCDVWVKPEYDDSLPATASVTFPDGQTVYGGKYDFVGGNGESKMASVDLGTLNWLYGNNSGRWPHSYFYASVSGKAFGEQNIICSSYKVSTVAITNANFENASIIGSPTNNYVYVRNYAYTDAPTFKTAMSGVQLVYELAEPIEIQLTPQEISTLAGENNVWGDGDITLIASGITPIE